MTHISVRYAPRRTLTEGGEPRVSDAEIITSPDIRWERNVILSIASEIESASSHPLAIAIQRYCEGHGAAPSTVSAFEETAGRGLKARFDALHCIAIIGNEAWIQAHGVTIDSAISQRLEVWKSEAKSVILLALQDEHPLNGLTGPSNFNPFHIAGIFAVTDPLRPEAVSVISWLQRQGINTWMISGDNAATAGAVAKTVGIPSANVIAGVLPHEKVSYFTLRGESLKVIGVWQRLTKMAHRQKKYNNCSLKAGNVKSQNGVRYSVNQGLMTVVSWLWSGMV